MSTRNADPYLIFQDASPTRDEVVEAARLYIGVGFSLRGGLVTWSDELGRYTGKTNCLKFLLHVARDVGYLPADFDVNLSRPHPKLPENELMRRVVKTNLDPIEYSDVRPGDVLEMLYRDVNRHLTESHHVALVASVEWTGCTIIHCEDFEAWGAGKVVEITFDAKYRKRVVGAWRLRGIRD
jgi:hypothetical protein